MKNRFPTLRRAVRGTSRRSAGFTLMEMLVVLALIALVSALVLPKMTGALSDSELKTAQAQVRLLRSAVETFRLEVGRYPSAQEGLNALVKAPADSAAAARWRGPYLSENEVPLDPWKRPYLYSLPGAGGQPFALYSLGADGQRGGEKENADIGILPPN